MTGYTVTRLPGRYALVSLPATSPLPPWAARGEFWSVTRTPDELSVITLAASIPAEVEAHGDWTLWQVAGPFDFAVTGVLSALSGALAQAGVPLLAVATYQTDYLLVQAAHAQAAVTAWRSAGHTVHTL